MVSDLAWNDCTLTTASVISSEVVVRLRQKDAMSRLAAEFVEDEDDEVFGQTIAVTGRVLPPTSSSYRYSHRVSVRPLLAICACTILVID